MLKATLTTRPWIQRQLGRIQSMGSLDNIIKMKASANSRRPSRVKIKLPISPWQRRTNLFLESPRRRAIQVTSIKQEPLIKVSLRLTQDPQG